MNQTEMPILNEALIENLSVGLVTLDNDNSVQWANSRAHQLLQLSDGELVGQRVDALPPLAQSLLKKGAKTWHDPTVRSWIKPEGHSAENGERLIALHEITDQELLAEENATLRQQVEDLSLTDELTGLANRRAISQALELQVSRSRRYQNPLSVVLVHVDLEAIIGVTALSTDPVLLSISRYLRDRLRWVDQIARWDDNVFLLVLPETTDADAAGLIDKIAGEQATMALPDAFAGISPKLSFGLACWSKGDDTRTLLRKAAEYLQESSGA